MHTAHATRIINRNTEKANFHDLITFDYRRGVFEVKTGRGTRGSSKGGKIQHVDLNQMNYSSTYEHYFMPMVDKSSWPQYMGFELRHDPDQIRGLRRPKSKRIANEMDEGRKKRRILTKITVNTVVEEMDTTAPGSQDLSVLTMQQEHRSTPLWDAQVSDTDTLVTRHPDSILWVIDERVIPCLELTSIVERWRQETHIFHLPLGEATITLLDVALLTRLPIEGRDVCTAKCQLSSRNDMVHRIFGERPPAEVIRGSGAVLFADKTNNQIQLQYLTLLDDPWECIAKYSWGFATLGYLYRRLCGAAHKNVEEIAGPLVILQKPTQLYPSTWGFIQVRGGLMCNIVEVHYKSV
ncbi:serine/threonine-protein phosphatase 7 long form homolog [Amaranthus tricolor]|uniref:serine/threonine-protein phosphatase 7 long form homolog n=1 Tax=Amaranthus tricolor TaxID=29722 RepID=UPI0025881578|nr:serine/threonine-protein phosphatase 7 long form homolog [Amaranthus tricolor]